MSKEDDTIAYLKAIDGNIASIKSMLSDVVNAIREAESEIPEKMRRFIMYMHDVHDVSYMYEERGHNVPDWIKKEMERCDDRYRQLLHELHLDDGTFAKVRKEMAKDPLNRWDHTRRLTGPKEQTDETGNGSNDDVGNEGGTEKPGD
jgi:hypothetical protein